MLHPSADIRCHTKVWCYIWPEHRLITTRAQLQDAVHSANMSGEHRHARRQLVALPSARGRPGINDGSLDRKLPFLRKAWRNSGLVGHASGKLTQCPCRPFVQVFVAKIILYSSSIAHCCVWGSLRMISTMIGHQAASQEPHAPYEDYKRVISYK